MHCTTSASRLIISIRRGFFDERDLHALAVEIGRKIEEEDFQMLAVSEETTGLVPRLATPLRIIPPWPATPRARELLTALYRKHSGQGRVPARERDVDGGKFNQRGPSFFRV